MSCIKSINGEIKIPGDKSISHRAAIISAIAEGNVIINNFLFSDDCINTIEILKKLGVDIKKIGDNLVVQGCGIENFREPDDVLYVGNSGTTLRLMCGVLSATNFLSVLTGDKSINSRPMSRIIEPLSCMGANITGRDKNKKAPVIISGNNGLKGMVFKTDISSAQVKSCLVLAGLYADSITEIIQPAISRDHTERMLEYFGANIKYDGRHTIIYPGHRLEGKNLFIPGDLSSAAYFVVASLILKDSAVIIKNIGMNPTRSRFIEVLKDMGANIEIKNPRMLNNEQVADIESRTSNLEGINIDSNIIPNIIDEIPVLCAAAAFAHGSTIISGAGELRFKESDRIKSVSAQFKNAGVNILEKEDGFIIKGNSGLRIKGGSFECYGDHRIAMSLAVLGLRSEEHFFIDNFECVDTSFPSFKYELKKALGDKY
ncbi:MAG: 3-phosphoshikimate 1-carboxyvinyltransferase [Actinobacteria bacterium]|nr:3-phosphoshikimate 1-carboxyvinyltransferase [Actinomycetota bacterium]